MLITVPRKLNIAALKLKAIGESSTEQKEVPTNIGVLKDA